MRRPVLPRRLRRPRLLIIGCGDIGQRIAALLGSRWRVLGIARSSDKANELRLQGIKPVRADLDQRRTLAQAAGLANWMMYLAPPPNAGATDPRVRNWLAAFAAKRSSRAKRQRFGLQRTAPSEPRLVYMSTTGVYGDQGGGWVSQTTPVNPTTPRAKRRVDAEQQIRRAVRPEAIKSGAIDGRRRPARLRAAILRVPGIYAADRLPEERLRKGLPVADGDGDGYTNHIHADDLARLTLLSLMRTRSGRALNTVDTSAVRTGQWLDLVAEALGLPTPPRVPKDQLAQYLTPMMLSFLTESRRINGRRALKELRTTLQWPTVETFLTAEKTRRARESPGPGPSPRD